MMNYCRFCGKVRYPTYWSAYRVLRKMMEADHHNKGSCYRCQACHDWHLTHFSPSERDKINEENPVRRPPSKKLRRSRRTSRWKRPWRKPVPLRREIKPFNTINRQDMTQEEFDKMLNSEEMRMAYMKINAANILADVIDSYLMDAFFELSKKDCIFTHEYKQRWKRMTEAVRMAKAQAKQCAHQVYKSDDPDAACSESDLLADLLLTILQRTNDASNEHMERSYRLMKATIIKNFKNLFTEHKKEPL